MPAELTDNHAVIDRIDDGIAVLLVGPAGDQRQLAAALLPDAAREGDVIEVTLEGETLVVGDLDRPLTEARRTAAQQRLARIRQGRSSGRFG